jgi:hypothetical protein
MAAACVAISGVILAFGWRGKMHGSSSGTTSAPARL